VEAYFITSGALFPGFHMRYWLGLTTQQAGNRSGWAWVDRTAAPPIGEGAQGRSARVICAVALRLLRWPAQLVQLVRSWHSRYRCPRCIWVGCC
jgi:hypothetical protein